MLNPTKPLIAALAAAAAIVVAAPLQAADQFFPLIDYRVGPYGANGTSWYGGFIDYLTYVNIKEGGVNGVKMAWEECETEYNNAKGVECYERLKTKAEAAPGPIHVMSTGISYALIDKVAADKLPLTMMGYGRTDAVDGSVFPWAFPLVTTYQMQVSAIIKYIDQKEGGKLAGKKIAYIYHDSAYGKEPIVDIEAESKLRKFDLVEIPVAHPGNEQGAQWLKVREAKPDWVIFWGWGVMNQTGIKAAQKVGFPRDHMIGSWWAGSEEDVIPAGDAAKGFIAAAFNMPGTGYPVMQDVIKFVYNKGNGDLDDKSRIGSIYHTRGVVAGIITVEAIRNAQAKFGKGKPITGEQMRWGIENLNIDEKRVKELGATGMMQPLKVSCMDHEGSGLVKFQQWDGAKWKVITDWMEPDRKLVRAKVEEDAAQYAKEKGITPRDCSKEQ